MKHTTIIILLLSILSAPAIKATEADSSSVSHRAAPYVVRIGSSLVINAALTEVLKASIHEMRPDRRNNRSWPSQHVSWTATVGSIVSHELYQRSPWWVLGSHAVTGGMMMERTFSSNHYPKDVLGGLAVGLVSTEIGYFIGRAIFPGSMPRIPAAVSDFMPAVDVVTTAFFPVGGKNDISGGTGVSTAVRGTLPMADHWGVTAALNLSSVPLYENKKYVSMVDGLGFSLGATGYTDMPGKRFFAEGRALVGVMRNFHGAGISRPRCSFTFDVTAGAGCALTPTLSLGLETGYHYRYLGNVNSSICLGLFTRASF
ncbi:MAG: hypothetical protein K2M00_07885 [Muribaculaceae bacterium]|nr:hypothetical protein [Muribaculaceae bacterium]